jgi:osmotically-inducible protein OsmY
MKQGTLVAHIEQAIARGAGQHVAVEDSDDAIVLSGLVDSVEARQAAADIAAGLAPGRRIDNNLEVEAFAPMQAADLTLAEPSTAVLPETVGELAQMDADVEPDFTDQALDTVGIDDLSEMPPDTMTTEAVDDSENVVFFPTDPVITTDDQDRVQVLGGFSPTADERVAVAPSALDNQPGDEALADAIRRALRRDAATTDLRFRVEVDQGVARLRGVVPGLEDADNAESVAARVPGVREVLEELEVADR